MFRNVVVGVERGGGGQDAIALGRRLLDHGGNLTLAHVYSGDTRAGDGAPADHDVVVRQHVAELLEKARAEAGVDANLRWQASSSAGRGLHELCELITADLLVVGSSRRGVVGRVLLGDDTHAALNGAPCAIAIAPSGYAERPARLRDIGVAYNGSAESEHALAVARALAAERGATLVALKVVSLSSTALAGGGGPVGDTIEALVAEAQDEVAALGGVEPRAAYGLPAEELTAFSSSVDLLVVGSRGYGPLGRVIHGSTSGRLARSARCPLLVLTRTAALADAANGSDREFAAVPGGEG